ncbi:CC_3452 family protein [Citromicrobium bathyomarinum]|uniref:CC_3452 family protein n=1 Tax=Citromicrobium bathyomarinum TaxID=72174 RepID=UPI003159EB07
MTLFQNTIRQATIAGVALLTTAVTFGTVVTPTPAQAETGVYYRATLAQPVEKRTEVIRGGTFICSGTVCVGTKARSRPELVCERLGRAFGTVSSFSFNGKELDAEALASCKVD